MHVTIYAGTVLCEDGDPGCHCEGNCPRYADSIAYRIDMEDRTGTLVCSECSNDMIDAGIFRFVELPKQGSD